MAAAAILNLLPVSIFSIWSSLDSGWGCSCKISCLYVNMVPAQLAESQHPIPNPIPNPNPDPNPIPNPYP